MADSPDSDKQQAERDAAARLAAGQRAQMQALMRARSRLLVCFWTLPVYVVAIWILLNNHRDIGLLMYVYMAICGGFAIDLVRRVCPACKRPFFVRFILMNPVTRRCVHCGFTDHDG